MLDGLTAEPAWPTLRGHLLLLAAVGADPVTELPYAAETRDLTSAGDQAAVIHSRIHQMNGVARGGPLPWLSGIPDRIATDPNWGPYLRARSQLVAELADRVRLNPAAATPAWAAQRHAPVPAELIGDIQVWRAATQVDPSDLRPTGLSNLAVPPVSSNSNSTSDSPPQTPGQNGNGGNWSLQKPPAPPRTHFCQGSPNG
jgi:hypothetical protein